MEAYLSLYSFQEKAVEDLRQAFRGGARSVVLCMPTGSGKTRTASALIESAVARGKRVVFAAHLDAIIDDTSDRLTAAGIHHGIVQAGRPKTLAPVQVGSLATLHSRGDRPDADLFILDECHHAGARSIRAILESYPKAHILGLTATPSRSDGKPLDMFEQLVCGPTTKELIAIGAVVPCEMYAPVSETDSHILAMDPMLARLKYGYGRRTIIFADSVGHAKLLVEQFDDLASLMIGDTSREDRVTARTLMKSGRRPVLIGYGVFLEGFDCPETELIILARKFNTTSAFLQAIGRGVRSSPGKTKCRAIDLCGSVLQHGLFEDDRKWSLEGDAVQRLDVPRLGRCVACGAIFPPMSICPRCGASSRSVKKVKLPRTRAQALEELSALSPKERDERYMKGFRRAAEKRGANPEWWARKKFVEKFHREPMK